MKKPYQIESQRAVKRLQGMAAEGNPVVQMVLPMADMLGWLREGVGELVRQAGLQLMSLLMEEEVRQVAGRTQSTTAGAQCEPMGQRARLLRGDGPKGADRASESSKH